MGAVATIQREKEVNPGFCASKGSLTALQPSWRLSFFSNMPTPSHQMPVSGRGNSMCERHLHGWLPLSLKNISEDFPDTLASQVLHTFLSLHISFVLWVRLVICSYIHSFIFLFIFSPIPPSSLDYKLFEDRDPVCLVIRIYSVLGTIMDWVVFSPHSYVETLSPKVTVFGDTALSYSGC